MKDTGALKMIFSEDDLLSCRKSTKNNNTRAHAKH